MFFKHVLLEQDLMTWQVMEEHYILVDIILRVTQYVAKCCLADKCYLGDLIAYTVPPASKSRQCTCKLSEYTLQYN